MSKKRQPRARAVKRAAERAHGKLARAREKLFELEAGGRPERPIEVSSPVLVEPAAAGMACPTCEGELRVEEHLATTVADVRLREARMRCARCGGRRSIWFRLVVEAMS